MYKPAAILAFALLYAPAAWADPAPCSERYTHKRIYPIMKSDIGADPKKLLIRWGIRGPSWGWERLRFAMIEGKPALQFYYPKGSINPANDHAPQGGASFYMTEGFEQKPTAACLRYSVYFPDNFKFAKGGKLPGFYGGRNDKGESASGCRKDAEMDGFSTRYMWRENGAGSLYVYAPGKQEKCGHYVGKGSWRFTPGQWTTLEQEVVLNEPPASNGVLRVWVDGKLVIDQPNSLLRMSDGIVLDGVFFVSFFGGKEPDWASPLNQTSAFSDISVLLP